MMELSDMQKVLEKQIHLLDAANDALAADNPTNPVIKENAYAISNLIAAYNQTKQYAV